MTQYVFVVDIKNRILKVDNEEIPLCVPYWGDNEVHHVLAEDTKIPPNSETIANAEIIGPVGLGVALVEPSTEIADVLIAKCLVNGN